MNIINALNNREIATVIWLTVIFLWAWSNSSFRSSTYDFLKAFFNHKIIISLIAMLIYIAIMVTVFREIGFWDTSATKDTVLWTFGSVFATLFSLNKVAQDNNYFKNLILDNLKFVLILEFVVNLYPFSLQAELFVIPIVSFIVMLNAYIEAKSEYKQVSKLLNYTLGVIGLFLLAFTLKEIVLDFQNFASLKNLRDFFLPPLFSVVLLPFVYIMVLFMRYETFFIRIDIANKNTDVANYAKRRVFAACHINLSKLNKASRKAGYPRIKDKNDILEWFKKEGL